MLQKGDADDGLIGKVPCASSGITASLYMRRSAKKKSPADQCAGKRGSYVSHCDLPLALPVLGRTQH